MPAGPAWSPRFGLRRCYSALFVIADWPHLFRDLLGRAPLLAFALLAPSLAWAHATQLSSARIELHGLSAQALLELNGRDLDRAAHTSLVGSDGRVSAQQLQATSPAVMDYLLARAQLRNSAGGACDGTVESLQAQGEHVLARLRWRCPPLTGTLVYRATLFHEIDPATRHVVTVGGDVKRMALLGTSTPEVQLVQTRAQLPQVLWHYLRAGAEHIAGGFDHIAFILAVILWGHRIWPLLGVVTAFTAAHSLTLTAAVLGWVSLPSCLTEILIAASIVYVAVENFFVTEIRHRWRLAFLFGLVHGFGFASALRSFGLPSDALVPALAAFNLGVEVGQILLVAAAMLAVSALGLGGFRCEPNRRFVLAVSAAIALAGVYWTVQRALACH